MNDEVLDALLIYCLDELEAGVPVAEILARYPEQADVIRPLLETAVSLEQMVPEPPSGAQMAAQDLFLAQARAMKKAQGGQRAGVIWWRRLAMSLALLLVVCVGLLALSSGTASALPGSALYPVKRTAEELRLSLYRDPTAKARLWEQYEAERQQEINILLATGGDARVECWGTLTAMTEDVWQMCNLTVHITERTVLEGEPMIGAAVHVEGVTGSGMFVATRVEIDTTGVTPTVTPTPTPSASPTAVPTIPPTFTAVPTLDPPTPTVTETAEPDEDDNGTETPEPDDDDGTETPEPDDDDGTETPEPDDDDGTETPEPDDDGTETPEPDDDDDDPETPEPEEPTRTPEPEEPTRTPKPDDDNSGSGSGNSGSGSGNSGSGSGNSGPGGGD